MPQRYPYQGLQLKYYARPYNASHYLATDSSTYSEDAFEAAQAAVEASLSDKMNLEYSGSARIPWPPRQE